MENAERERAIQLLEYYGEKLGCKTEFNLAIKALEGRPIGKWEFFSIGNNQYTRCSICKDEHTSEGTDLDWWYDNFKYCPKCGAYMMRGEECEGYDSRKRV